MSPAPCPALPKRGLAPTRSCRTIQPLRAVCFLSLHKKPSPQSSINKSHPQWYVVIRSLVAHLMFVCSSPSRCLPSIVVVGSWLAGAHCCGLGRKEPRFAYPYMPNPATLSPFLPRPTPAIHPSTRPPKHGMGKGRQAPPHPPLHPHPTNQSNQSINQSTKETQSPPHAYIPTQFSPLGMHRKAQDISPAALSAPPPPPPSPAARNPARRLRPVCRVRGCVWWRWMEGRVRGEEWGREGGREMGGRITDTQTGAHMKATSRPRHRDRDAHTHTSIIININHTHISI